MGMQAPDFDKVFEPEVMQEAPEEMNVDIRLKVEWSEDEKADIDFIQQSIEERIRLDYAQAFAIEEQVLAKVRTPLPPGQGPGWARNMDGSYIEDWSRITPKEMESFVQAASSEAFFASQRVIDSYAEAVFAKFNYDDAYDEAYSGILTGTVSDKTAKAKRRTQKERWMALYRTLYYKRAKEVVDRLDAHVRRVERIYTERQKEADRAFRASRSTIG